ncbi:GMC oxidoreductase [Parathielavia appendiculata]|uniref:GMC oxidoreductase n=1 Tax=Parathielavia appendiculata TaxID=2587402 RepID=A0AAN6U325_9PEZI|nr:GMC oxidoreductase [Parathielavia appendiculata]
MAAASSLDQPFDYIVVGGGTAGLVVANRLTENSDVRVLVVEAGADRTADPLVLTPGLAGALYGKEEYDWNFLSPPQPTLKDRCINQSRGKMLGGSSGLNFLMLMYPPKGNIDAWAALGNPSWNYDALTPYFRKFATVHPPPQSAKNLLGLTYLNEDLAKGDGPIHVSFSEGYGVTNKAWMQTFADLGLGISSDPRDGKALGAFQNHASIDPVTHTRSYACTGYYAPEVAKRPNLVVLTETLVNKILFNTMSGGDAVATGVEIITKDGEKRQVSARTEVILAAGALQTPQILELSGVGGRDLLEKHGIPVIVDNPNVGEHLQDHPIVCQSFEVADGVPSGDVLRDPNVLQTLMGMYRSGGAGPLGQSIISVAYAPLVDGTGIASVEAKAALFSEHEATLTTPEAKIIRSLIESPTEPAFQYLLFPSQVSIPDRPTSMAHYITPVLPENYITIMTILNQPFSRGSVHVTSPDVKAPPLWDPRYNANPLDMELLARGVQFVERIVDPATPFGRILKQPDGKRQPALRADADAKLETAREIVRQRQISVFHVAGSCAMRPREEGGVVDERLRVYGTKGLRVVDASVFPLEPVGNIQSVVYAVAERAADLIKEDRLGAI